MENQGIETQLRHLYFARDLGLLPSNALSEILPTEAGVPSIQGSSDISSQQELRENARCMSQNAEHTLQYNIAKYNQMQHSNLLKRQGEDGTLLGG